MKIKFKRPTIYMSHSIRGDGSKTIQENCERASKVADKIRSIFPEVDIYCPGDADLVLQLLWESNRVSTDDIMWADIEILKACHGWFWTHEGESEGCEEESYKALELFGPGVYSHIIYSDLIKANYGDVRRIMTPIVESAKARFYND